MFGVLQPLPIPSKPWEYILINFVVELPEWKGFDAIYVVVDRLSKMRQFIPCHTTIAALGLAEWSFKVVVHLHGLPGTTVSDQGPQFTWTLWSPIWNHLGIDGSMWTAFYPQSHSQTERMNASMGQYLWVSVNDEHGDWLQWCPMPECAENNAISEITKCTLFSATQGTEPQMLFSEETSEEHHRRRLDADQVQATMHQIHDHLQVEMRHSQVSQEEEAIQGQILEPNIQEGSHALLVAWHIGSTRPTRTLVWTELGPFTVTHQISLHTSNHRSLHQSKFIEYNLFQFRIR